MTDPLNRRRNPWTTLDSRPVYENPWIAVREDRVIRPGGRPGIYGVVQFRHLAIGDTDMPRGDDAPYAHRVAA